MITLKTLPDASAQEVFDQVVTHLRKQGKQSKNTDDICSYRGYNGLMCAAGCLISDEEYTPEMDNFGDGRDWDSLVEDEYVPRAHDELIKRLQYAHDFDHNPETWMESVEKRLQYIANGFNLEYKESE